MLVFLDVYTCILPYVRRISLTCWSGTQVNIELAAVPDSGRIVGFSIANLESPLKLELELKV